MASIVSITVVQASLDGTQLLITDAGTYTAPVSSRVLTIFDSNGVLLATVNMGTNLTYTYTITADAAFLFVLNVTDGTGVLPAYAAPFCAQGFYTVQFLSLITTSGCGCDCNTQPMLDAGEDYLAAAQRFTLANQLPAAQANIVAANEVINNPY